MTTALALAALPSDSASALALLDPGSLFQGESQRETLTQLFTQYEAERQALAMFAAFASAPDVQPVLGYFFQGNEVQASRLICEKVFALPGALKALDAAYWDRALRLTDVLESMPADRRHQWEDDIFKLRVVAFEPETVFATLAELLERRKDFLAERVDGLFRALSPNHLTNTPQGFGKRMIIARMYNSFGLLDRRTADHVDDLRRVIAKFSGTADPASCTLHRLLDLIKHNPGTWYDLDGGALRIRVYKNGSTHLEVHPEMAWRLNFILASRHPRAIPGEHRKAPKTPSRDWRPLERPLPGSVLELLLEMREHSAYGTWKVGRYNWRGVEKATRLEVARALEAIGAAVDEDGHVRFAPDLIDHRAELVDQLVTRGSIPDRTSHQYYPTPEDLARRVVDLADLEPGLRILEPSAGQGSLAAAIVEAQPDHQTLDLVELSPLNCDVLRARSGEWRANVINSDFLAWGPDAADAARRYDRIIMNPPFSEGRWKRHLEEAVSLLRPTGVLVAVLPASAIGNEGFRGYRHTFTEAIPFTGTSVWVTILRLSRA